MISPNSYFGSNIDSGEGITKFWGVDKIMLTQTFATVSEIKTNAESKDNVGGLYVHQWNITDFTDSLEIYTLVPVTGNWYLIALIVVIVLTGIIYMASVNRIDVTSKRGYIFKKKNKFIWINKDQL